MKGPVLRMKRRAFFWLYSRRAMGATYVYFRPSSDGRHDGQLARSIRLIPAFYRPGTLRADQGKMLV